MKNLAILALSLSLLVVMSGCATSKRPTVHFPAGHSGMAHRLEKGKVVGTRDVVIDGRSSLTGATLGGAVGTAIGVAAVGPIEDERDLRQTVGSAAVGGAVGAVVGQMIEKRLTERRGQELSIELESGERLVVVQELGERSFEDTETVYVYTTHMGNSRVFHEDEDPYVDPETNAYIVSDELEEQELEPVEW
ncbi:hypothetical protein [Pelagicoccus sp. SDUM812002]|uniref:hypothetical protein n=1 Tax=Pelagicoccus sp. SDUM812002 TaxID=3041266 RepID=UPI002810A7F5|nr:hypothetical protein [Pelagicoccus sp. SDUM812002]